MFLNTSFLVNFKLNPNIGHDDVRNLFNSAPKVTFFLHFEVSTFRGSALLYRALIAHRGHGVPRIILLEIVDGTLWLVYDKRTCRRCHLLSKLQHGICSLNTPHVIRGYC